MKRLLTGIIAIAFAASAAFAAPYAKGVKIKKQKGITLCGVVSTDSGPVADVAVTDGETVVYTDSKGVYQFNSSKPNGLVYISTPSGYRPQMHDTIICGYWQKTTATAEKWERHDFLLEKEDQQKTTLLITTDTHICNHPKRKDLEYYQSMFMPKFLEARDKARSAGNAVYSMNLGDITWDRFWYSTGQDIPATLKYMVQSGHDVPWLPVMGNHDNDPAVPAGPDTDFQAAHCFRDTFGPTYYSVNLGSYHIIVLDNIFYKNEKTKGMKTAQGVWGSRNYDVRVTKAQVEWLKKDLERIPLSTPLIVCAHGPILRCRSAHGEVISGIDRFEENRMLLELLKERNVTIFTGHMHQSHNFLDPRYPNAREFNLPAVAGELWKVPVKSKGKRNFGDDGADAGFVAVTLKGTEMQKEHWNETKGKSQFKGYDTNSLREFFAQNQNVRHLLEIPVKEKGETIENAFTDFSKPEWENKLLINVWCYMEGTKVEAKLEDGTKLKVERKPVSDPWAIRTLFAPDYAKKQTMTAHGNCLALCENMYVVDCPDATSTVIVKVKNPDGTSQKKTYKRPAKNW